MDGLLIWSTFGFLLVIAGFQFIVTLALGRQIGQLNRRLPPVGARTTNAGPELGGQIGRLAVTLATGATRQFGGEDSPRPTLLLFLSMNCGICDEIIPALQSVAKARPAIDVLIVSASDDASRISSFAERARTRGLPIALGEQLTATWRVAPVPYAVMIDELGIVRSKGMVANREQLESILAAASAIPKKPALRLEAMT
jgi:methylamine dehydrogenase accessory protein MauD